MSHLAHTALAITNHPSSINQAKIAVLEERLAEKKEDLLEHELVQEEVSTLSKKLRAQATDGREDTLKLVRACVRGWVGG